MTDRVTVRVRDCACPGRPHGKSGDEVYLKPMLGLDGGAAAEYDLSLVTRKVAETGMDQDRMMVMLMSRWSVTFVEYGAIGWNLVHKDPESGDIVPRPFDVEVLLADYRISRLVSDKADELYGEAVTAPLVERASAVTSTRDTPIEKSTSPTPKRTRRSSGSSSQPGSDGGLSATSP